MLNLSDFTNKGVSSCGRGSDSHQLSLSSASGEDQLITLKDNVIIKSMGLISHEQVYDGEVFQSPECRGSGMRTGENTTIWRWRPTNLCAGGPHMADQGSRELKGGRHRPLPHFLFWCGLSFQPRPRNCRAAVARGGRRALGRLALGSSFLLGRNRSLCSDGWYLLLQQRPPALLQRELPKEQLNDWLPGGNQCCGFIVLLPFPRNGWYYLEREISQSRSYLSNEKSY